MFLAGCSFVLALVLSVTDDGSQESQDCKVPVSQHCRISRPLQPHTRDITHTMPHKKLLRAPNHFKLPVELTDYIIDLLQSDVRTLKSCALASRLFLPRARYHLFRSFSVRRDGKDPYKLRFYPNVARCIRSVTIRGNLCFEVAHSTLADVGLVESLHLEGSVDKWQEVQWTLCRSQLPNFPRLKELSLSRVYFRSLGEIISTLRCFKSLSKLSLDFEDTRYTNLPPAVDLSVQRLATIQAPLRTLHMRLNLLNAAPGKIPQLLLACTGPTLCHLSLEVLASPQRMSLLILDHFNLAQNTSLESLDLYIPWYISRNPWVTGISQDTCHRLIHTMLTQIHSTAFRQIHLHISFPLTSHYNNGTCWQTRVDFGFLDVLAPATSTSRSVHGADRSRETVEHVAKVSNRLQNVTLALSLLPSGSPKPDRQAFEGLKTRILEQLPLLASRGILHIVEESTMLP